MASVFIALAPGIEDGQTAVLGMSLLDRALLALRYGGVTQVTVLAGGGTSVEAARAQVARRDRGPLACQVVESGTAPRVDGPLVLVAGDAVINQAAVREAIARAGRPGAALLGGQDGGLLALPEGGQPGRFDDAAGAAGPVEDIPFARYAVAVRHGRVGHRRAVSALLASCRKATDSWWTRAINRNVSLQITRLVAHTPITPNMLTACALVVGLAAAFLVYRATGHLQLVLAYALGQFGDMLDCADGETARVTYRYSRYGPWFDTVCDDIVSLAIHVATGVALWNVYDRSAMAYVSWGGAACFALYMAVLYYSLAVHAGTGDAGAMRWWTTSATTHDAAAARVASDTAFDLTELARTASNREILLFVYMVTAALHALPVGAGVFGAIAISLAFVSVGQIIKGYPRPPASA
jgi:phosphatidylglycerophosphate synthase